MDLLKDFPSVFAISAIDDVEFLFARNGYLGDELQMKARRVANAKVNKSTAGGDGL